MTVNSLSRNQRNAQRGTNKKALEMFSPSASITVRERIVLEAVANSWALRPDQNFGF